MRMSCLLRRWFTSARCSRTICFSASVMRPRVRLAGVLEGAVIDPGPRRQTAPAGRLALALAGACPPQAHHPLSGLEVLKLIREHLKVRRLADLWMLEYLQVPKVARLLLEAETNPLEGVNRERSLGALKVEE